MATSPSTTPGVDVAAHAPSPVAPGFAFSYSFTAADFAPPRRPHPRPWHRVPVPAMSAYITLRKVWKRVGAVPLSAENARYLQAAAELRADGQQPRKSARTLRHVPVWGEARWKETSAEEVLPASDIASVDVLDNARDSLDSLSRVPRKRNSQRKPIAPQRRAAAPPLDTAVEPPAAPESASSTAIDAPADTEDLPEETPEHITKRAKRRMSRRISILPQLDSTSPQKKAAPAAALSSPAKRRTSFFVLDGELPMAGGSPTKLLSPSAPFEPLLTSSPTKAPPTPASLEKLDTVAEESVDASSVTPTNTALEVVVFSQPTAEVEAESPQEVRRRISLHNTRRRESWRGSMDAMDISAVNQWKQTRTGRRHSLLPGQAASAFATPLVFESTANAKSAGRRHTFQPGTLASMLSSGADFSVSFSKKTVPEITVSEPSQETTGTAEASAAEDETETVVVDARTNLDIFGSGPPVQVHSSSVDRRVSLDLEAQMARDEAKPAVTEATGLVVPEAAKEEENVEETETDATEAATTVPLDMLEETAVELPCDNTSRELTPDLDMTPTEDSSRDTTDEQSLVSHKRESLALDESLLLPLPDTTETDATETDTGVEDVADVGAEDDVSADVENAESHIPLVDDGWRSPTSAELCLMQDLLDSPLPPASVDMSNSPMMAAEPELDFGLAANATDEDALEADVDDPMDDGDSDMEDAGSDHSPAAETEANDDEADAMLSPAMDEREPGSSSPSPLDDDDDNDNDNDQVDYTVTQPIHMLHDVDETTATTMDLDAFAEEQEPSSAHEDSETEMLRKFVTRVKADKSAKAAAAAAATSTDTKSLRTRHIARPKRRSGSMGSTTSASGSPIAKENSLEQTEASHSNSLFSSPSRAPLAKKDNNMSPSPRKKRKELSSGVNFLAGEKPSLREGEHADLLSKPSFDDHSPPRPKRRRRKMEADTGSIYNPEFMSSAKDKDKDKGGSKDEEPPSGPRRSKRTRSNQADKASVVGVGGVLSLIPVRLPGSLNLHGEDSYGLAVCGSGSGSATLGLRRNDEKDLATMTRVNTRKNKAGCDPPGVVIQRLTQERAQEKWRAMVEKREQREQRERDGGEAGGEAKCVFDSPLPARGTSGPGRERSPNKKHGSGKKKAPTATSTSKGKTVRWAEVLARFQEADSEDAEAGGGDVVIGSEDVDADKALPAAPAVVDVAPAESEAAPAVPVLTPLAPALATAPATATASASASAPAAAEPEKRAIPRRTTRVSRLPPPTPSKVIAAKASLAASASSAATATPGTPGLKAPRMATRRARIVGMGMAANGTPAPKRRTTRTV